MSGRFCAIEAAAGHPYLALAFWRPEALTLHHKGRVNLHWELAKWVAQSTAGMKEAVLTHEIMAVARQLSLHQDPSDRMIAATALVLDLTLVTADIRLLGLGNIKTLANR
jgi:PIN domain nuclease of toxin-antitoxin system